jgi:hypothetical protein
LAQELLTFVEKRMRARHLTQGVIVKAKYKDKWAIGYCVNMCVGGALIHVEGLEATKHSKLELVFAVPLNKTNLTRLYFKEGIVEHITGGNIGLSIGNRTRIESSPMS